MTSTAGAGEAVHDGVGEPLVVEIEDGVATLLLNRPRQRNALDREVGMRLLAALREVSLDDRVRAVVLTGSGDAFCSGDDLDAVREFYEGTTERSPVLPGTVDGVYLRIIEAIVQCPKPVVAGINGAAAGAGTEIACAADYRLASDRMRMGSCLVRVGHVGNAVMLARVVGPARATEIFLTGRFVEAEEALRIGLVDVVVPHDRFVDELAGLARRFAGGPTKTIGLYKDLRERTWGQPVEYGLRMQDRYHMLCNDDVDDAKEGAIAFLDRRTPRFRGM